MAEAAATLPSADVYQPRRPPRTGHLDGYRGRLGITRWGPDSDDPIVLLHGWMDGGAALQLLVDCLPESWPLVAIDWAGYGGSDRRPSYLIPEYLADLQCALDRLVPQKPARLVGHSLGGMIAALWAGLRPERTRWLVNLEGLGMTPVTPEDVPPRVIDWLDSLQQTAPPSRGFASIEQLAAAVLKRNPRLPPAHARFLAQVWTRPAADGIELLADERHYRRQPFRYGSADIEACWRLIKAPSLLLWGRESDYVQRLGGEQVVARWHELVPHSRIAVVEAAAHMLQYEQPAQVARHIIDFAGAVS